MNTITSSSAPPVSPRKVSALEMSLRYLGYTSAKNCSLDSYRSRWIFSMYCPCGPCMEVEAAWTRSGLPSYTYMDEHGKDGNKEIKSVLHRDRIEYRELSRRRLAVRDLLEVRLLLAPASS